MTWIGADYSSARPGGATLRAAGVVSVGRYLADEGDGRQIELSEFNDLKAHGVSVWFVREGYSNGILGGTDKGVSDARIAVANLARLGLTGQVVYAACDFDIDPSQFPAADAYMRGFASVIGVTRTGIYGGMYYINHCRTTGLAKWFWQAGATSWDRGQTGAVHIQQTTRTPPVPGSDHNFIYEQNHGQAGQVAPEPIEQEEEDDDMAAFAQMRFVRASDGKTVGLVFNAATGWYQEFVYDNGRGSWYKAALGAGDNHLDTEGMADSIIASCQRVGK